jgi:prevent-host-death family protein
MPTITTHEAKTHLSRYLAAVEKGAEFLIARGKKPVARLVPVAASARSPRPKVGKILGKRFEFPASAFAPTTEEERTAWGL